MISGCRRLRLRLWAAQRQCELTVRWWAGDGQIYKRILPQLGGYLTDRGNVYLDRAEVFLTELGKQEAKVFKQRLAEDAAQARRGHRFGGASSYVLNWLAG